MKDTLKKKPADLTPKRRDVTEKCPDCKGEGVVDGYYTLGPVECQTCGGDGSIPKGEVEQMRAKSQEPVDAASD